MEPVLLYDTTLRDGTQGENITFSADEKIKIALRLDDLRVPPGNRLEALKRRRADQYSIRINDQWRICFRWTAAGPEDVEIVDYH